jgi:flagellar biosynthesis component FlhA
LYIYSLFVTTPCTIFNFFPLFVIFGPNSLREAKEAKEKKDAKRKRKGKKQKEEEKKESDKENEKEEEGEGVEEQMEEEQIITTVGDEQTVVSERGEGGGSVLPGPGKGFKPAKKMVNTF